MGFAEKLQFISEADYLAGEAISPVKREYLGGVVQAMPAANAGHNTIAGNILVSLHRQLRGKHCRPFNSDSKVCIKLATHTRYYYPDASVVCGPYSPNQTYFTNPALVFEVTSRSTRRVDHGEKREAYLQIPSLEAYLIVESGEPKVTVWRRTGGEWEAEVYTGMDAEIEFPERGLSLPLAEFYDGAGPVPEDDGEGE